MFERRPFSQAELLTWSRYLTVSLLGITLAVVRDRVGSIDDYVSEMSERLAGLVGGADGVGVEAAMLSLLLSLESLGLRVESNLISPDQGEVVVGSLPGEQLCQELEDRFEVQLSPAELLGSLGIERDELNRVLDLLGLAIAAASGLEYARESDDDRQRLALRVW